MLYVLIHILTIIMVSCTVIIVNYIACLIQLFYNYVHSHTINICNGRCCISTANGHTGRTGRKGQTSKEHLNCLCNVIIVDHDLDNLCLI